MAPTSEEALTDSRIQLLPLPTGNPPLGNVAVFLGRRGAAETRRQMRLLGLTDTTGALPFPAELLSSTVNPGAVLLIPGGPRFERLMAARDGLFPSPEDHALLARAINAQLESSYRDIAWPLPSRSSWTIPLLPLGAVNQEQAERNKQVITTASALLVLAVGVTVLGTSMQARIWWPFAWICLALLTWSVLWRVRHRGILAFLASAI